MRDLSEIPTQITVQPPQHRVVIQLARLGDFLQSTPLLAELKNQSPGDRLAVLVTPAQAPLARHCPFVDQVLVCDPVALTSLARERDGVHEVRRAVLSSLVTPLWEYPAATVINLNLNRVSAALAAGWSRAGMRGWRYVADQDALSGEPWSRFVLALVGDRRLTRLHLCDIWLAYASGDSQERLPRLSYQVDPLETVRAAGLLPDPGEGPLVILQLGANHDLRRWPLRNFADLAAGLIAEKVRVACVGSEREHRLAHRLKRLLGPSGQKLIDLMGRTDLPTLAACLQIADLVVGADTGTLHLATAVGARVLALYMGPAAVHETGPYGSGHLVMQARDRCGPCREEDPVCQGEAPCRWLITPHMALTAARALLKGDSAAEAAGNLELPAGVQALEAGQDRFGQVYLNLTPQVMTASLAASLALRQAGRMLLRPGYDHDLNELDMELHGQYLPADDRERGEIAELGKAAADLSMAAAGGDISAARLAVQSEPCLWPMAEVVYRGEHPRLAQAAEAAAVTLEACRRF